MVRYIAIRIYRVAQKTGPLTAVSRSGATYFAR